ncbi:MAG: GtrA family protein [Hadesarchaea archaeon]|nr:GtrA family protein [Hadesarchaea archaeon]
MGPLGKLYRAIDERIEIRRLVKFCLVGASGVGVNLGLLWVLTEYLNIYYLISAGFSIECSILTNFILNEFWTFSDRATDRSAKMLASRMIKFNVISAGGLAINIVILGALTELFGIYYMVSALFGIAGATMWNYLANTSVTWRRQSVNPYPRMSKKDVE